MTDDMKSTTVPEGYDEADPCCASVQWHCAGVACCGCEVIILPSCMLLLGCTCDILCLPCHA